MSPVSPREPAEPAEPAEQRAAAVAVDAPLLRAGRPADDRQRRAAARSRSFSAWTTWPSTTNGDCGSRSVCCRWPWCSTSSTATWRGLSPKRQSMLGADLDSLADVISFGLGPAVLGYTLGLRGGWDMVCLTFFVVCGVSRLARFNVTAPQFTTGRYREGQPLRRHADSDEHPHRRAARDHAVERPRAAGHVAGRCCASGRCCLHPLVLIYVLSGSAMISTVRIPKP